MSLFAGLTAHCIVVVDDERDILESIEALLVAAFPKARILTFVNPIEALRWVAGDRPSLIITDYRMPVLNGLEFLDAAHRHHPTTPSLLVTGAMDSEQLAALANRGPPDAVMRKPFDAQDFVSKVRDMIPGRAS